MKLKMQARHLWDAVEFEDVEFDEDRSALDAICSAVLEDMVTALATKASAKEAWEAIRTLHIGDDRVWKATAQNLRAEYESIALREGEAIEDFALRLTGIMQRLATLGDPEPDEKVVAKYLRMVRPRYKQLVISIETLLDIYTLSIEEVTGRLKAADATSRGRGSASSAGFGGIQSTHISTVYSVPGRTQPTSLFIQTWVHLGPTRFNPVKPPIQTLPLGLTSLP